jgi:thioredoxin-like negative regulator of GroEL
VWPFYSGYYATRYYYDYDDLAPVQYTELSYGEVGSRLAPMLGGGDEVDVAFGLGEERFSSGEFEAAVAAFEESVLSGTADPSARIALALALIGAEDYPAAARVLNIGLAELPEVGAVALDVTALFDNAAAWEGAVARLHAASQREPGNADLMLLMGFTLFAAGDLQEARDYLWSAYDLGMRDSGLAELVLAAEGRIRGR